MELKSCPFCGGKAIEEKITMRGIVFYKIRCETNHCTEKLVWHSNPQTVEQVWNRRAEPPNEPLTLDELRQMDGEPV